jgi:hypothetical protein
VFFDLSGVSIAPRVVDTHSLARSSAVGWPRVIVWIGQRSTGRAGIRHFLKRSKGLLEGRKRERW